MKQLILGSTSIYRKELMLKMGIPFATMKPTCDEDTLKKTLLTQKKSPLEVAEHLAYAKAASLNKEYKEAVIIGGDQLVDFNGEIIGKSKTKEKAKEQLAAMAGHTHQLITSIAILKGEEKWTLNHISKMKMKKLSAQEIENYINLDLPLDCAGSYKIEQSGICLFEKIETDDFSAIQGLPMMWISQKLKEIGYELFTT
jgi:septum formation protein